MDTNDWLAERFEEKRPHLRGVAYRMLGSLTEADDAVQEAWLRLSRADVSSVENLGGWLTTIVARVCLDMLRSRKARREESLDAHPPDTAGAPHATTIDPEQEAVLADAVGLAMLVVLDLLDPAERIAFVLHDMFSIPFDAIAPVVGRSPAAARQLASRARRRVQGADLPDVDLSAQRRIVDAFLTAVRAGNVDALVQLLDGDAVLRLDRPLAPGGPTEMRGADVIAKRSAAGGARAARPALVDGAVGVVIAPRGRLLMVLRFTVAGGKITEIEAVSNPERLRGLELAVIQD